MDDFTSPSQERPNDFQRTNWGAPLIPDILTGKLAPHRRPSGYQAESSQYNLLKWKERQLVIGLLLRFALDVDIDVSDRAAIDALIGECYEASQTSLAADRGTHVHALTEHVDRTGTPPTADMIDAGEQLSIPTALQQRIIEQWLEFRARLGVTAVAIEQPVVNDTHGAAGTVDRVEELGRDLDAWFGLLCAGDRVVADIKTGKLTTDRDGVPRYWGKYPAQMMIYGTGVPFDTADYKRIDWGLPPRADIGLIYHYDLVAALDGEPVEWKAIPVNLHAGRDGVNATAALKRFEKRKDLFGPALPLDGRTEPAATDATGRRERLLERYHALAEVDQRRFIELGVDRDDLDAVEQALDAVDPFCQVQPPQPRRRTA